MDADEQVGLHAACLLHPHVQGYKKISIARHVSPHVRLQVNAVTQAVRNLQHHIFFTRAASPYSAGVFAAMTRV